MYVSGARRKSEEDIQSPGTAVVDGCEPPCLFWEPNLGPLQENNCSKLLSGLSNPDRKLLVCLVGV